MTKRKPKEEHLPDGRPPFYKTPGELQKKVDEYFAGGFRKKTVPIKNKGGEVVGTVDVPYITITDLCIFLGFESKQSFYDYEERPLFSYSIKRARLFIEREYEEMLRSNPTGAIFALKNFKWTDKQEIDMNVDNNINYKDIPTPQLLDMLNKNLGK